MDIQNLTDFIRRIPLLSLSTDEELIEFIQTAELKPYGAGEFVFEQGSAANQFYIVYSGKNYITGRKILSIGKNLGSPLTNGRLQKESLRF